MRSREKDAQMIYLLTHYRKEQTQSETVKSSQAASA
jgi:hypothetical protein